MYASPLHVGDLKMPTWADVATWWPLLLANASVAFALNVTIAIFMKRVSAVGFILAGIVKDAVIVMAGAAFMGESLSHLQMLGFGFQLIFIWTWSLMKLYPKQFEGGIIEGVSLLTTCEEEDKSLLKDHAPDESSAQAYGGAEKLLGSCHEDGKSPVGRSRQQRAVEEKAPTSFV